MCKCENVQMCKWSPFVYAMQVLSRTKVTICTFAHSHICTLILVFFLCFYFNAVKALAKDTDYFRL